MTARELKESLLTNFQVCTTRGFVPLRMESEGKEPVPVLAGCPAIRHSEESLSSLRIEGKRLFLLGLLEPVERLSRPQGPLPGNIHSPMLACGVYRALFSSTPPLARQGTGVVTWGSSRYTFWAEGFA